MAAVICELLCVAFPILLFSKSLVNTSMAAVRQNLVLSIKINTDQVMPGLCMRLHNAPSFYSPAPNHAYGPTDFKLNISM